jgi:hypothetical protein
MSETHGIFTPVDHDEYATRYWRHDERQVKMSRTQQEDVILGPKKWRGVDPEFEMYLAAEFLAAAGVLGGASSRLGASRDEALRLLRRYLTKAHLVALEETLEDYDLSAPHPPYEFGRGWTAEHQRLGRARARAAEERNGIQSFEAWEAERHSHWYLRLIDSLPSRQRLAYSFSIARRWRWIRYAI